MSVTVFYNVHLPQQQGSKQLFIIKVSVCNWRVQSWYSLNLKLVHPQRCALRQQWPINYDCWTNNMDLNKSVYFRNYCYRGCRRGCDVALLVPRTLYSPFILSISNGFSSCPSSSPPSLFSPPSSWRSSGRSSGSGSGCGSCLPVVHKNYFTTQINS